MREPIGSARNRVNVVSVIWRSTVNAMTQGAIILSQKSHPLIKAYPPWLAEHLNPWVYL